MGCVHRMWHTLDCGCTSRVQLSLGSSVWTKTPWLSAVSLWLYSINLGKSFSWSVFNKYFGRSSSLLDFPGEPDACGKEVAEGAGSSHLGPVGLGPPRPPGGLGAGLPLHWLTSRADTHLGLFPDIWGDMGIFTQEFLYVGGKVVPFLETALGNGPFTNFVLKLRR